MLKSHNARGQLLTGNIKNEVKVFIVHIIYNSGLAEIKHAERFSAQQLTQLL